MISKEHRVDRRILWMIMALEALLFHNFYAREIASYPPQNFDQAVYLTEAYRLEERIHAHGLGEVWRLCGARSMTTAWRFRSKVLSPVSC